MLPFGVWSWRGSIVMFPTMREVFISTTIECGSGAPEPVSQKVLLLPSIALEQGLPAWELSQVTVHPSRGIAANITSATAGFAAILSSRTPSNVALVPTARGFAGFRSCGAADDKIGQRSKRMVVCILRKFRCLRKSPCAGSYLNQRGATLAVLSFLEQKEAGNQAEYKAQYVLRRTT